MALSALDLIKMTQAEREDYESTRMEYIKIDDEEFTGYLTYSFFYDIVYAKEPTRTIGGQILLDSYTRFLVPRIKIKFAYMTIDTYRRFMEHIYNKAEHKIECYDPKTNQRVVHNYYFQPNDFPELFQKSLKVLGIINYQLEMTGTNTKIDTFDVTYHLNPPPSTGLTDQTYGLSNVIANSDILIGSGCSFQNRDLGGGWKFKNWNTSSVGNSTVYTDGNAIQINSNLTLYAIWQSDTNYTLSFDYGFGDTKLDGNNKKYYNKTVTLNSPYGELPTTTQTKILYNGVECEAYETIPAWYKVPVIQDSALVTADSIYLAEGNTTIYQIFTPKTFTITFNSVGGSEVNSTNAKYGEYIYSPTTTKQDKTFGGWWTTQNYVIGTQFEFSTMPPTNITLYAKWS